MKWPWVARERLDDIRAAAGGVSRDLIVLRDQYETEIARYDVLWRAYQGLLKQTLALKQDGFAAPSEPRNDSAMSQLGPLTRSALAEMGNGQTGPVKRAMQGAAIALHNVTYRDDDRRDELTAIAVRQGERIS